MAIFQIISNLDWDSYDVMAGATVTLRKAGTFQYSNAEGYVVTVTGTGFAYDGKGIPNGGTLTRITVKLGDTLLSDYTGLSYSLAQFNTYTFGTTSGSTTTVAPDFEALFRGLRAGNDEIFGNALGKNISGYDGNDTIHGGGGDDWLSGGAGVDRYYGDAGNDGVYFGYEGQGSHGVVIDLTRTTGNILDDGFGNVETATGVEKFEGNGFNDKMTGNGGDNTFFGDAGNDTLSGGGGDDDLFGNSGKDVLSGGGGYDRLDGGAGKDRFDGGLQWDYVVFWGVDDTGHGVTVDMTLSVGQIIDDGYGNVETMTGVEGIGGSDFGDRLTGDAAWNELVGNAGNDTLAGGRGNDRIWGGDGTDKISGGDGEDGLIGDAGADTLNGGAGKDFFVFFGDETGFDTITDFTHGTDVINVRAGAVGLAEGALASTRFLAAAGATSATTLAQRFIYDTTTDSLYLDADGKGGVAAVKIAVFTNNPVLTAADFALWL